MNHLFHLLLATTLCVSVSSNTTGNTARPPECSQCPPGSFLSALCTNTADRACTRCPPGKYSNATDPSVLVRTQAYCSDCSPGKYAAVPPTRGAQVLCSGCSCVSSSGGTEGSISDGSGSSEVYANDLNCRWTISAAHASGIKLYFRSFDTEAYFDNVMLYSCKCESLSRALALSLSRSLSLSLSRSLALRGSLARSLLVLSHSLSSSRSCSHSHSLCLNAWCSFCLCLTHAFVIMVFTWLKS
jgi:hypothetical protein